MTLMIRDTDAHRLARELAHVTGESVTAAVIQALRERLARAQGARTSRLSEELLRIGRRCAALQRLDSRPSEEILRYDSSGAPLG
jgi:antitoxin VapB